MTTIKKKRIGNAVFYSSAILATLCLLGYMYYLSLSRYQLGIIPPLEKSTPFISATFKAEKGTVFHQSTGTNIIIPANALVDENGKKVKGMVTLKFREFQNAREIFQSGIPMQLNDDRSAYFSSAGMMELNVYQKGKELELSKNESVKVELASAIMPDEEYKLYFLTDDLTWDNGAAFETVKNERRDSALAALPPRPNMPISPIGDTSDFTFEIVSDYKRMPHLKVWKDVKWKLISADGELDPNQALRINWDKISITKKDVSSNAYQLDFSILQTDYAGKLIKNSFSMVASPQLSEKELARAQAKFNKDLAAYKTEFAAIEKEEERLMLEAGILNKFELNQFGVCNIDKLKDSTIVAQVSLSFDFEKELIPEINKVMLYLVLENERSVVKFNAFDWDDIPILDLECSLVAVLPNGKIAYVSKEQFKAVINKNTLSPILENKFYFKTEKFDYDDFNELITPDKNQPRFI